MLGAAQMDRDDLPVASGRTADWKATARKLPCALSERNITMSTIKSSPFPHCAASDFGRSRGTYSSRLSVASGSISWEQFAVYPGDVNASLWERSLLISHCNLTRENLDTAWILFFLECTKSEACDAPKT